MTDRQPILIITAGGMFPWIIINRVASAFPDVVVLQEQPESKWLYIRRKASILGWWQAVGQFLTMVLSRFGKLFANRRIAAIMEKHQASGEPDPAVAIHSVTSVNDAECLDRIAEIKPRVVLLISCRLLKSRTLEAINCPVLNYHPGITPKYRGMWGGYWARAAQDLENYGSTVHLVDTGVDTGDVLYQVRTQPDRNISIFTDAFSQAAESRDIVVAALTDALEGRLKPKKTDGPSIQHFHPPIWRYLWTGLSRGIW